MQYLFFDTESSNCFNNVRKMCELGWLFADENLTLLEGSKRDLLINPGKDGKFNLTGRKGGRDINLAHPFESYKLAPLFDALYDNVKFLLTQKEVMIFLWSSENDIQAILDQCFRYHLPQLSFVSYDVQVLFRAAFPELVKTPSLEAAMDALGLSRENLVSHRPDDDALMTLLVLKGLCEKTGKSVLELINDCPQCKMESISTHKELWKRHKEKEKRKRLEKERKEAMAPFNEALNEIFAKGVPENVPLEKTFTVSANMNRHIDETLGLIQCWLEKGYWLKRSLGVAYLVAYDKEEVEALKTKLDTTNLTILTKEEFSTIAIDDERV